MSRPHLIMLLALAAIWGVSFLFIEIASRELAPEAVILLRIGSGALALGIYVALRCNGFGGLRASFLPLALRSSTQLRRSSPRSLRSASTAPSV